MTPVETFATAGLVLVAVGLLTARGYLTRRLPSEGRDRTTPRTGEGDAMFQTTQHKSADRKDHVWRRLAGAKGRADGMKFKCLLCGAVTPATPPDHPTPAHWLPAAFEPLTAEERALVPPHGESKVRG